MTAELNIRETHTIDITQIPGLLGGKVDEKYIGSLEDQITGFQLGLDLLKDNSGYEELKNEFVNFYSEHKNNLPIDFDKFTVELAKDHGVDLTDKGAPIIGRLPESEAAKKAIQRISERKEQEFTTALNLISRGTGVQISELIKLKNKATQKISQDVVHKMFVQTGDAWHEKLQEEKTKTQERPVFSMKIEPENVKGEGKKTRLESFKERTQTFVVPTAKS